MTYQALRKDSNVCYLLHMDLKFILGAIRKADQDYKMIEDNDKIAVAVSGGKDSMLLLLALSVYARFKNKHFTVMGIHIDVGFEEYEHNMMKQFADQYNIELLIEHTQIYPILKKHPDKNGHIQCALCSNLKKGALFKVAKANGCNKIALGHHGDDAVETLLLNMMYGSKIATFQPKQYMSRQDMYMIRPFIYAKEKQIIEACRNNGIPAAKRVCPNDGFTQRQTIKELLQSFYDTFPFAQDAFIHSLSNEQQTELWKKEK